MSTHHIRVPLVAQGTKPELKEIEARILQERGRISLLYQVLLNSAPIAQGWEAMLTAVRNQTSVPADLRELMILRVAVLNKGGGPRLMLAAHADEIAMSVNFITAEGFIHVRRTGGIDPAITKAQRITIHTRQGPVLGVVGNVAPHLTRGDGDAKAPKMRTSAWPRVGPAEISIRWIRLRRMSVAWGLVSSSCSRVSRSLTLRR